MNPFVLYALVLSASVALVDMAMAGTPVSVAHYAKAAVSESHCSPMRRPNESVYMVQVNDQNDSKPNLGTAPSKPAKYDSSFAVNLEDGFIVSLHQAYIKNFPEWHVFGKKTGDIAIVATVRERTSGTDFDFTTNAATNGRVVFYQENVEVETTLNLSNVPVYGPAKYTGYPLMITLHVIEIDEKGSKRAGGIIGKLAELSKVVPHGNAKALSMLDSLGSLLLSQNKNDVIARYDMELLPSHYLKEGLLSPTLEYGHYLFVAGNGPEWHNWTNIYLNQKNSRVYSGPSCDDGYKDKTWLTFQINGASPTQVTSFPATSTLNTLLEALGRNAQSDIQRAQTLVDELKGYHSQQQNFEHGIKIVKKLTLINRTDWSNELQAELRGIIDKIAASIATIRLGTGAGSSAYNINQCKRLVDEMSKLVRDPNSVLVSFESFDVGRLKALLGI